MKRFVNMLKHKNQLLYNERNKLDHHKKKITSRLEFNHIVNLKSQIDPRKYNVNLKLIEIKVPPSRIKETSRVDLKKRRKIERDCSQLPCS
jgi:hypothetical protein